MYALTYYNTMMKILYTNIDDYLCNPLPKSLLKGHQISDLPNLLLQCKSCPVSLTFIKRIVAKISKIEHVPNLVPIQEDVESNAYFFQINISNRNQSLDFIINVCQQKTILESRHVIVLNIKEHLKHNVELSVKSVMNKYCTNAIFIIRNDGGFRLSTATNDSCQILNLKIDTHLFAKDFENDTQCVVKDSSMELMNMCIMLEWSQMKNNKDIFEQFVVYNLDLMTSILNDHNATIESYGKALRDFCIKIGASGVEISSVCKLIHKWSMNKLDKSQDILYIVTELEHSSICMSKPLFSLEKYIDLIIQYYIKVN